MTAYVLPIFVSLVAIVLGVAGINSHADKHPDYVRGCPLCWDPV